MLINFIEFFPIGILWALSKPDDEDSLSKLFKWSKPSMIYSWINWVFDLIFWVFLWLVSEDGDDGKTFVPFIAVIFGFGF